MNIKRKDVFLPLPWYPFPSLGRACNSLLSYLGTYNNQYMVLDLKKVKLQKSLDEGALYIVEQIPTLVEYSDQTNVLRKGNRSYSICWPRRAISLCQLTVLCTFVAFWMLLLRFELESLVWVSQWCYINNTVRFSCLLWQKYGECVS